MSHDIIGVYENLMVYDMLHTDDIILTKYKSHTDESDDELCSDSMEQPDESQKVLPLLIYEVLILFNAFNGHLNRFKNWT